MTKNDIMFYTGDAQMSGSLALGQVDRAFVCVRSGEMTYPSTGELPGFFDNVQYRMGPHIIYLGDRG